MVTVTVRGRLVWMVCVSVLAAAWPACSRQKRSDSSPSQVIEPVPSGAAIARASQVNEARAVPQLDAGAPSSEPELRESAIDKVQIEGREGSSLAAVCAAWKADLISAVRAEHDAGFGLDGYDEKGVTCVRRAAPRIEGTLPEGWSVVGSLKLDYFDGVLVLDNLYLLLKRADGTTVIGPLYRTANDMGDVAPPAASRLAMGSGGGMPVLLMGSLEIGDRPDPAREDGTPGPNARYIIRQSGRVCRFEATRFSCDPTLFTEFEERQVSAAERAALLRAPKAKLPPVDPTTGKLISLHPD